MSLLKTENSQKTQGSPQSIQGWAAHPYNLLAQPLIFALHS